jgi:hypothetical protein
VQIIVLRQLYELVVVKDFLGHLTAMKIAAKKQRYLEIHERLNHSMLFFTHKTIFRQKCVLKRMSSTLHTYYTHKVKTIMRGFAIYECDTKDWF